MAKHPKRPSTVKVTGHKVSGGTVSAQKGTRKPVTQALIPREGTREASRARGVSVVRSEVVHERGTVPGVPKFRALREDVIKADARGRITVGNEASDKQYRVLVNGDGQILLDPVVFIPAREAWLFNNPRAAMSVLLGIEQSEAGQTVDLGSFAGFANADEDDE